MTIFHFVIKLSTVRIRFLSLNLVLLSQNSVSFVFQVNFCFHIFFHLILLFSINTCKCFFRPSRICLGKNPGRAIPSIFVLKMPASKSPYHKLNLWIVRFCYSTFVRSSRLKIFEKESLPIDLYSGTDETPARMISLRFFVLFNKMCLLL